MNGSVATILSIYFNLNVFVMINAVMKLQKQTFSWWLILVLGSGTYFYMYDTLYLNRDLDFGVSLATNARDWAVWLVLIPVTIHCSRNLFELGISRQIMMPLLAVFLGIVLMATGYQFWIHQGQNNLIYNLLFCWLPINIQVVLLVLMSQWWKGNKHQAILNSKEPKRAESLQLRCLTLNNQNVRIDVNQIVHIKACGNYLVIHTMSEQYTLRATMKMIEQKLQGCGFIRIHRSHLVNENKILKANSQYVYMEPALKLPLGRSYRPAFEAEYSSDSGEKVAL